MSDYQFLDLTHIKHESFRHNYVSIDIAVHHVVDIKMVYSGIYTHTSNLNRFSLKIHNIVRG